jgi:leucyl aminopeptidase (aminopeptidase T)
MTHADLLDRYAQLIVRSGVNIATGQELLITAPVDVSDYVGDKRRAMRAHASQIGEDHLFLSIPDEVFAELFGTEWFIREGRGPGIDETDLMAGL